MIFQTYKTKNIFCNKTSTPLGIQADLVYKFSCSGCEAIYVGETQRHLRTRVCEHAQPSRNTHVYQHHNKCIVRATKPNIDEFKILAGSFKSRFQRKCYEALKIIKLKPSINVQRDFEDFLNIYK